MRNFQFFIENQVWSICKKILSKGNFMKKICKTCLTVSLFLFSGICFVDEFSGSIPTSLPGEKVKEGELPAGYNKSASYKLKDSWDLYFTADYICRAWIQNQGLDLSLPSGVLGFGFNMRGMDDWNFYTQYTYYRSSGSGSQYADLSKVNPLVSGSLNSHGSASLSFDKLDALLQRPFYFGKKLKANFLT